MLLCTTAFKTHADKGRRRNLLSQDPRGNHDRNANQGGCRPSRFLRTPRRISEGAPARSLRFCFPDRGPWREELRQVDAEAGAVGASLSSGSQPGRSQHRSELSSSLQEGDCPKPSRCPRRPVSHPASPGISSVPLASPTASSSRCQGRDTREVLSGEGQLCGLDKDKECRVTAWGGDARSGGLEGGPLRAVTSGLVSHRKTTDSVTNHIPTGEAERSPACF